MKSVMHIRFNDVAIMLFILINASLLSCGKSPHKSASGKIGKATISIDYSSPSVKSRNIWGELVPYNKIWRAGANAATIFETDKALTVAGKSLPAGRYSLFAIPRQSYWTIIFNSQTGQQGVTQTGEANLDRVNDVLTVSVSPNDHPMTEDLTYEINQDGIALLWEQLKVQVKMQF